MGVEYTQYLLPRDSDFRPEPDRVIALIEAWVDKRFILPRESLHAQSQRSSTGPVWQDPPRFQTAWPAGMELPQAPEPEIRPGLWTRLFGGMPPRPPVNPWLPFATPPIGQSLAALANAYTIIEWNGHLEATYPMQTLTGSMCDGVTPIPHRLMLELSDDFVNPDPDPYDVADGTEARKIEPLCACGHDLARPDGTMGWIGERVRRLCPQCGRAFRPEDQIADIVRGHDGRKIPRPGGLCHRFGIMIGFDKDHPLYAYAANGEVVDAEEGKVTPLFMQTCRAALGIELEEFGYYT
jgi:hypothetical protein